MAQSGPSTTKGVHLETVLIGSSPKIVALRKQIARVATKDARVLILGSNGAGKEIIAQQIHKASGRAAKPYVTLNCSAIPESLFESELFGHEKGAFTGASERRTGHVEQAEGGSLFLDEIGDLPLGAQSKLLRILQEGTYQRVGGKATLKADIRVIAATNKDLNEEVRHGRFRRDLYHRLAVHILVAPALKERIEDIPQLVAHYGPELHFEPCAMLALQTYAWPGNVRELINVIERLRVIDADGHTMTASEITEALQLDHVYGATRSARPSQNPQMSAPDVHVHYTAAMSTLVHELLNRMKSWAPTSTSTAVSRPTIPPPPPPVDVSTTEIVAKAVVPRLKVSGEYRMPRVTLPPEPIPPLVRIDGTVYHLDGRRGTVLDFDNSDLIVSTEKGEDIWKMQEITTSASQAVPLKSNDTH